MTEGVRQYEYASGGVAVRARKSRSWPLAIDVRYALALNTRSTCSTATAVNASLRGLLAATTLLVCAMAASIPAQADSFLIGGSAGSYAFPESAAGLNVGIAGKSGGIGGTGSGNTGRLATPESHRLGVTYTFDAQSYRQLQRSQNVRERFKSSGSEQRTEFQFHLRPGKFDFSLAGGFGLGGVFSNPVFELRSSTSDRYELEGALPELHDGLSYSAGVNIEHENEHISDTAYVSSGQLGVSYGRMGRVWYSGVDVSFQQSAMALDDSIKNEVVSFDLTTGRRIGWTGNGADDPLWLLSLRGDFDVQNDESLLFGETSTDGDWFLNPSLFWDTADFKFAAQLEVPIDQNLLRDFEPPSYKLRAIIEKSFK